MSCNCQRIVTVMSFYGSSFKLGSLSVLASDRRFHAIFLYHFFYKDYGFWMVKPDHHMRISLAAPAVILTLTSLLFAQVHALLAETLDP